MNKNKCINYCIDGRCSNCGNCCTEMIPLTVSEVKLIKAYVKEKHIEPDYEVFSDKGINLLCPFRDMENHKCKIYEVRPKICRVFKCNQDERTINVHKNSAHLRANYNKFKKGNLYKLYTTRELIYGNPKDTIRCFLGTILKDELLKEEYSAVSSIDCNAVYNILKNFGREEITKEMIYEVIEELKILNE